MLNSLLYAVKQRNATDSQLFPDLPESARGLPKLTAEPCVGSSCHRCIDGCPTGAIVLETKNGIPSITLDRGVCVTCNVCTSVCPTGTITNDRSTRTAARKREDLVLRQTDSQQTDVIGRETTSREPFRRSIEIREVSTGCNATDLEVAATTNPIFDCSRFGIHFVASPRYADALLVTGPVAKAMQEPLLRCYEAMAEPRIVIAVGSCAISGGVHRGGYAGANGVMPHLNVDVFVPGCPPHPWSILHGILLAAGSRGI